MDANKAIIKGRAGVKPGKLGYLFWLGIHIRAVLSGVFHLPGYILTLITKKMGGV